MTLGQSRPLATRRRGDVDPCRLAVAVSLWLLGSCLAAAPAAAQVEVRGFADVGLERLAANDSFEAITGRAGQTILGGGLETTLPRDIFASIRASRLRTSGHRVFLFEGERFDLGIPTRITITPLELTVGYRVDSSTRALIPLRPRRQSKLIPYAGAGIGWYRFEESSAFADPGENAGETFLGFHLLGGAIVPIGAWFGLGAEAQWSTVPDALGQSADGVSQALDETDLGGVTLRVKILVGR